MRTREEMDKRKRDILYSAYELFCERGIFETSISEIAVWAKVGTATVYRYYKTKATLLFQTQLVLWEAICTELRETTMETEGYYALSGLEQLRTLICRFEELCLRRRDYLIFHMSFKSYLLETGGHVSAEKMEEMRRPVDQMFLATLKKGQADGSISRKKNPDQLRGMLWLFLYSFLEQAVTYEKICRADNFYAQHLPGVTEMILELLK